MQTTPIHTKKPSSEIMLIVQSFVSEMCYSWGFSRCTSQDIHKSYTSWASQNNKIALSSSHLGIYITKLDYGKIRGKNGVIRLGLILKAGAK